jgi:hypothetical protein
MQLAETLLDNLQFAMKGKHEDEQCVGPCFVELAERMKFVYGHYCMNHNGALTLLKNVSSVQLFAVETEPLSSALTCLTCILFVQLRTAALRLIVRSWLDVPTFATRRHHARAPSGGRWNCGREMSGNFVEMTTFTPFRDLLQSVKLRHGTDSFTSPPKEGMLRIFLP